MSMYNKSKIFIYIIVIFTFLCLFFISCTTIKYTRKENSPSYKAIPPDDNDLILKKSYIAAQYLNKKLKDLNIKNKTILITTFSNNESLELSNALGRLIPYLISTKLSHLGYNLIDLRLNKKDIRIEPGKGEFILTRNLNKLNKKIKVDLILTGHYSIIYKKVYIHCEIISPLKKIVLSSYDFVLPYKFIKDRTKEWIILPSIKTS
ncbi:hypothetical protein JCM12298_11780 [Desulfothermus naphthae]